MERQATVKELLGAQPTDVLLEVLRLNPHIEAVGFLEYFPQGGDKNISWLNRNEILEGNKIQTIMSQLQEGQQLAIGSRILLNTGRFAHVPLMDFDLARSIENLKKVQDRLKHVGVNSGWILETWESYHYWGTKVITEDEWLDFLSRGLLTSIVHGEDNVEQITDARYIGHSLRDRSCFIRISGNAGIALPKVVAFFNN